MDCYVLLNHQFFGEFIPLIRLFILFFWLWIGHLSQNLHGAGRDNGVPYIAVFTDLPYKHPKRSSFNHIDVTSFSDNTWSIWSQNSCLDFWQQHTFTFAVIRICFIFEFCNFCNFNDLYIFNNFYNVADGQTQLASRCVIKVFGEPRRNNTFFRDEKFLYDISGHHLPVRYLQIDLAVFV